MSRLELHLLGDFQITLGGNRLTGFRSEKVRALFTYLAVESERSHQRSALATLLWGDYQDAAALSSLRTALYNLRQMFEPIAGKQEWEESGLIVTRTRVQFLLPSPSHYWSDLTEFDALVAQRLPHVHADGVCCDACLARLTHMAELYGGDFLGSFTVSDALEFDIWHTIQREIRHRQACNALHDLIAHHNAVRDYPSVARYAHQILALEPWLEADHRHLMRALALTGQRGTALAQYQACAQILDHEFGALPDPETVELYEHIRSGRLGWEGEPGVAPDNPYRGLEAFGRQDAPNFFGREALIERLLARLGISGGEPAPAEDWETRFVALIGPSGSGKSSVVQAGLIPKVLRITEATGHPWLVAQMRPGADPVANLATALASSLPVETEASAAFEDRLRTDPTSLARILAAHLAPEQRLLLVLDQAEEFFTLVPDRATLEHISALLLNGLQAPEGHMRQITVMRADYYALPLDFPRWGQLFHERMEVTLPLTPEALQQIIVGPAERVGVRVEPELVATMVVNAGQTTGALPLLQYTLTELFERREGNLMTQRTYEALGGMAGALARRAEALYHQLAAEEQQIARQVFLRLVVPQEERVTVRRKVVRSALFSLAHSAAAANVQDEAVQTILDTFGRYRLLTFDRDTATGESTIEIAHEALIDAWDHLSIWVTEAKETLYRHRRLESLAETWELAARDSSYLLRGQQLTQFEELLTSADLALSTAETAYLEASLHEREQRQAAEAARQAREAKLERRARQRRHALSWVMVVATIVALSLAGYAFTQRRSAVENQRTAEREAAVAHSLNLASSAQLAQYHHNTDLALTLALEANQNADAPSQVQLILSDVAYAPGTRRVLTGHTGPVNSVAVAADGRRILSASADGTLILWDAVTGERVRRFQSHDGPVHSVVWLPGERQALSASSDGRLIVWDVASGTPIRRLEGHDGAVRCVTLSPIPLPGSGHLGALSGSDDGTLILWDVDTGEILRRLTGHNGAVLSVAISPNVLPSTGQHMILSGSMAREVIMWDFPSGDMRYYKSGYENTQTALDDQQQNGHFDTVWAVGFTPNGRAFSASQDENVMLWNPETGALEQATHLADGLFSGTVGEGGSAVLLGTLNSRVLVVDAASSQVLLELYGHASRVLALALMPDKRSAVSGGEDGALRLWDLHGGAETRIFSYPGDLIAATAVDVAPDQRRGLVAWMDNSISVWDMDSGMETCRLRGHQEMPFAGALFFPDSRRVASGSGDIYGPAQDNTVRIWDVETCQEIQVLSGHTDRLWDIAINSDGEWIVSGAHDGTVRLWNVAQGRGQVLLDVAPMAARSVAFSPDGVLVAVGLAKGSSNHPVYDVYLVERVGGAVVRRLTGHTAVVTDLDFSPDGRQLLSVSVNGDIILWDVAQGRRLRSLTGHTNAVMAVDFHPDGRLAASGSADSSVILWDTVTGDALRRYTAQAKSILSVAFAPDGERLFSVGDDLPDESVREIHLDISADALLDWVAANRYAPELTCEQRVQYHVAPLCDPTSLPTPN